MSTSWHLAGSLEQLRKEINTRWPSRDRKSDGTIGDSAHSARVSDHNPNSRGSVNALDIDADGVDARGLINGLIARAREEIRETGKTRLYYIIHKRKIYQRKYNFEPRAYYGLNAHLGHIHFSVLQAEWAEKDTSSWGVAHVPGLPSSGVAPKPAPGLRVKVDGILRPSTIRALQNDIRNRYRASGPSGRQIVSDGKLGGETYGALKRVLQYRMPKSWAKWAITGTFGTEWVKRLQWYVGAKQDGKWGKDTTRKLQEKLNGPNGF